MIHVREGVHMLKGENPTARTSPGSPRHEDAIFTGWQETHAGETFALYMVTAAGHPSLGSTLTDKSLLKLNLQVPRTPSRPARKP